MDLVHHGGNCCGVKTIKGFYFAPHSSLLSAVSKKEPNNKDKYGHHVSSDKPFFTDAAPQETALARLDRLLQFLRDNRPSGLVEAYLISNQVQMWDTILKERGFKADKPFKNSNSGNMITRYSLVMTPDTPKKVKAAAQPSLRQTVAASTEG